MAGDSLKWIVAPLPYSVFWAVLGVLLILLVVGWFVGVLVWTLPVERLRTIPVLRDISARVLQRKFSAAVGRVDERYRAGELNSRQAYAEMSRILRNFVYDRTGVRAQYMALGEVATVPLPRRHRWCQLCTGDNSTSVIVQTLPLLTAQVRRAIQSWS